MSEQTIASSVGVTVFSSEFDLELLGSWGEWDVDSSNILPKNIKANSSDRFLITSHNRAGMWFRAIDPITKQEMGFASMSFVSPRFTSNSAEGSHIDGLMLNAGLQEYVESGSSFEVSYKINEKNHADWMSGNNYSHNARCEQTMFEHARAFVEIDNEESHLEFAGFWNDNNKHANENWYWEPSNTDIPDKHCKRTVVLKNNDHAGIFVRHIDDNTKVEMGHSNLTFSCPVSTHNAAEGSNTEQLSDIKLISAGLQPYEKTGTPANFKYVIGDLNAASWHEGAINSGQTVCPQTKFANVDRVYRTESHTKAV